MFFRALTSALLLAGCLLFPDLHANEPGGSAGTDEASFFPETVTVEDSVMDIRRSWELEGVDSAIRSGFLSVAETLVEQLAASSISDRETGLLINKRLKIELARGELEKARQSVDRLKAEGLPVDPLLESMLLFFSPDEAALRDSMERIDPAELDPDEQAWRLLLQALLLAREGSIEQANQRFLLAENLASTPILADHFEVIRLREDLNNGLSNEETISALRESVRSMNGERGGFEAARLLADPITR